MQRFTRAFLTALGIVLVFGAITLILWSGSRAVVSGAMSGGELAQFLMYSMFVGQSAAMLSEVWGEVQRGAGAMERLAELLTATPAIRAPENPLHLLATGGLLDDTWWHRSYWVYGRSFAEGAGGWPQAGKVAPSGRILALVVGALLGPPLHLVSADWGLLITGVLAGTLAFAAGGLAAVALRGAAGGAGPCSVNCIHSPSSRYQYSGALQPSSCTACQPSESHKRGSR